MAASAAGGSTSQRRRRLRSAGAHVHRKRGKSRGRSCRRHLPRHRRPSRCAGCPAPGHESIQGRAGRRMFDAHLRVPSMFAGSNLMFGRHRCGRSVSAPDREPRRRRQRLADRPYTFGQCVGPGWSRSQPRRRHVRRRHGAAVGRPHRAGEGTTTSDDHPTLSGSAGAAPGDSPSVSIALFAGATTSGARTWSYGDGVERSWTTRPSSQLADEMYTAEARESDAVGKPASARIGPSRSTPRHRRPRSRRSRWPELLDEVLGPLQLQCR